ncbi:MAG: type II secretion system F family protein [Bacteriovoracaceae bacterium]|nr:type II secretion system F family protein [Bacteriovoracaceae bacterium]
MADWNWEGFDRDGKKAFGIIQADSKEDARKLLRIRHIRVSKLNSPSVLNLDLGTWLISRGFARSVGDKTIASFTKKLSILISAGVPILKSLEILHKQEKNIILKESVRHIAADVGSGKTLSDAMSSHKQFDRLYYSLVRAGEVGGILDNILQRIATYLENQIRIKGKVKSAMLYPAVVTAVGVLLVSFLMTFVVPRFAEMLKGSGQTLPFITQAVLQISSLLRHYGIYIFSFIFILFALFKRYIKTSLGRQFWDRFIMTMPLFGNLVIKANLASFSRTLSTLLSSGVSLIDALDTCAEALDNVVVSKDVRRVRKYITEGKTLSEPLSRIYYFPEMVSQMVKVGESTGKLDEMLAKVADVFDEEVEDMVANLTKLIEPLILLVLGGIVAIILLAMYLPIFMTSGAMG